MFQEGHQRIPKTADKQDLVFSLFSCSLFFVCVCFLIAAAVGEALPLMRPHSFFMYFLPFALFLPFNTASPYYTYTYK